MAVTANIIMNIKRERVDEFKQVLKDGLPDTRAFSGCRSVRVMEDQDKAGRITLLVEWDSKETGSLAVGFVDGEPVFTYLDSIDI
jgi:quinol monooxygenase YgiN